MFQSLPGFREFAPAECAVRQHLFAGWRRAAQQFGFVEYDAPILEPLELYTEKSGPEIVGQLFAFEDRGGRKVALRPEMTPSLCRLVGARAGGLKRPVKWFAIGEMYRFERPQKGRTRAFYQFNADILGEAGPGADAELIALCLHSFRGFGLTPEHIAVRLSDRTLWLLYLEALGKVGADALPVLSVIDKLDAKDSDEAKAAKLAPHFGEAAPAVVARLDVLMRLRELDDIARFFSTQLTDAGHRARMEARLADWRTLLETLRALGFAPYVTIDLGVVRGLAYYTGFVFEVFERTGAGRALAGGGRYDDLVAKLGYQPLVATGFAAGDVTLTDLLSERGLLPSPTPAAEIFIVAGGAERPVALATAGKLRQAGWAVEYPLVEVAFGKQFKAANAAGVRFAVILGSAEVAQGVAKLKDMASGEEATVPLEELVATLAARR